MSIRLSVTRLLVLASISCGVGYISAANAFDQFIGHNCGLASPPPEAGEDAERGVLAAKIFPRKSNMDGTYSGCQTAWLRRHDEWVVHMVGFFENGRLVKARLIPAEKGEPVVQCAWKNGKLILGDETSCSFMILFPMGSYSPNCYAESMIDKRTVCTFDF
jgi:hypothetical protein